MLHRISPCLFAILAGSLALVAQDPEPKKVPDKEVAERIDVLEECVKDKKMTRDAEGVAAIDFLLEKLKAGLCKKDIKDVTKAFDQVLLKGKKRSPQKLELYVAAVVGLGYCEEDGAKALTKAFGNKRFPTKKEWVPLRERILKSIGKTKSERSVKFLLEQARRSPEDALMAAAGEALGNFEDSKEKVRKDIVDQLLIKWGELDSKATRLDPGDIQAGNARNTLSAISGKWNETLASLTGQNFTKFFDWQQWYQDNKSKRWK